MRAMSYFPSEIAFFFQISYFLCDSGKQFSIRRKCCIGGIVPTVHSLRSIAIKIKMWIDSYDEKIHKN